MIAKLGLVKTNGLLNVYSRRNNMEPYYAVACGIVLTVCGYILGKDAGFKNGIEASILYFAGNGVIRVKNVRGEESIVFPEKESIVFKNDTTSI